MKLSLINSFNRMQRMGLSLAEVAEALSKSPLLELDPSRARVRAKRLEQPESASEAEALLLSKKQALLRSI